MDEVRTMLRRCRSLRLEIASYEERLERLRSQMESATVRLSHTPKNGISGHDRLSEQIARLMELESQLADRTIYYEQTCRDAEQFIDGLPEQQRNILWYRYIDGLSWRKISDKTHYDVRWCTRLHSKVFETRPTKPIKSVI